LDAEGLVLGVQSHVDYEEKRLTVEPGSRVLLYTDGATECRNEAGQFYESGRLATAFVQRRDLEPQPMIDDLLSGLRFFRGNSHFEDDITLVGIEFPLIEQTPGP
jgi:serine phosphatase RsbU (regulator of sigma subunit)